MQNVPSYHGDCNNGKRKKTEWRKKKTDIPLNFWIAYFKFDVARDRKLVISKLVMGQSKCPKHPPGTTLSFLTTASLAIISLYNSYTAHILSVSPLVTDRLIMSSEPNYEPL